MVEHLTMGVFHRSLPLLVAAEHQSFLGQGLEVDCTPVESSGQQFADLRSGRYQLVHTAPDNVLNYRLNPGNALGTTLPVVMVAGMDRGLGLGLMTRSGVRLENFSGRTLSVDAPDSGYAYVAYALLERRGFARQVDYEVVSHGGAAGRLERLLSGQADATLLSGALALKGSQAGLQDGASVGEVANPYLGGAIAVTQPWLEANLDLALRFLRGFVSATRWALDPRNGDRARELLARTHAVAASTAARLYALEVDAGLGAIPDGQIPTDAFRNVLVLRQRFAGLATDQDADILIADAVDRAILGTALASI